MRSVARGAHRCRRIAWDRYWFVGTFGVNKLQIDNHYNDHYEHDDEQYLQQFVLDKRGPDAVHNLLGCVELFIDSFDLQSR